MPSDDLRVRKRGDTADALIVTCQNGDGSIRDLSGITPASDAIFTFQPIAPEAQEGAAFTGAGTVAFVTDGTDGQLSYTFTVTEVATVRTLETEVQIDFGGGATSTFPVRAVGGRLLVELEEDLD